MRLFKFHVQLSCACLCACVLAFGQAAPQDPAPSGAAPAKGQTAQAQATHVPQLYLRWERFFTTVTGLEDAAKQAEAKGDAVGAVGFRNLLSRAAGLSSQEGAILLEVATDCKQALLAHDAQVKALVEEFRATHPLRDPETGRASLLPGGPERFQQRVSIIYDHVGQLHDKLGEAPFQKLAAYALPRTVVHSGSLPAASPTPLPEGSAQ